MAGPIRISILADATRAVSGFKQAEKGAEGLGSKLSKFGGIAKTALAGGAIGGALLLGKGLKDAVQGSIDGARALRVLNSQIKNLGTSGKAAFADADSFADSLGRSLGVDDDKVRAVETKLASFPDAFKKGSAGADAMHRAVKAAFDLQAIGIGDAEGNIVGIGKALNDPIKGMNALAKSGVSFSKVQQDQIKNAIKNHDLAKAQQILLQGIESNAKGAASAAANPFDKVKVAVSQIVGSMSDRLLPTIQKIGDFAVNKLVPGFEKFADKAGPVLTSVFSKLGTAFNAVIPILKNAFAQIQAVIPSVVAGFQQFVAVLQNPIFQSVAAGVLAAVAAYKIYQAYLFVVAAATKAYAAIQLALNVIMDANPIGLVVLAIVALVAALVVAYKRSETFRDIVNAVWGAIRTAAIATFNFLKGFIVAVFNGIKAYFSAVFSVYKAIFTGAWNVIRAVTSAVFNAVKAVITSNINAAKAVVSAAVNGIKAAWNGLQALVSKAKSIVSGVLGAFRGAVGDMASIGRNIVQGIINGVSGMAGALFGKLRDLASGALNAAKSVLGIHSPSTAFKKIGMFVGVGFIQGLTGTTSKIMSTVKSLASQVIAAFPDVTKTITTGKGKNRKKTKVTTTNKEQAKLLKLVNAGNAKLATLAKKRDALTKQLSDASAKLADLQKKRSDTIASVADTIKNSFKLVAEGSDGATQSISGILARAQRAVKAAQTFTKNIALLAKRGLSTAAIQELADAGPEAAASTIDALLKGTPAQIKQLNTAYSQLASSGTAAGTQIANSLYNSGISAAQGLVAGLKKQQGAIAAQMLAIAKSMQTAIKKALGIHSPSKVFARLGEQTIKGFQEGFQSISGKQLMTTFADQLSSSPVGAGNFAYASATPVGAGGGDFIVNFNGVTTDPVGAARQLDKIHRQYQAATGRKVGG